VKDDQAAHRRARGQLGGRPPRFDAAAYRVAACGGVRGQRLKRQPAVATRYDKLACRYQATVAVADIFIWLRARPDRTRS
jgi:hypothetical protein